MIRDSCPCFACWQAGRFGLGTFRLYVLQNCCFAIVDGGGVVSGGGGVTRGLPPLLVLVQLTICSSWLGFLKSGPVRHDH